MNARTASTGSPFVTRAALVSDLRRLGLGPGDAVLAHGALRRVGRLLNGPDIVVGALLDAVSPGGTVLAYTDWDGRYDELLTPAGRIPEQWRATKLDRLARSLPDARAIAEELTTCTGTRSPPR